MSLFAFIVRRLFFMVFVLVCVSILVFVMLWSFPPGMRLAAYVRGEKITADQMDALIRKYGLNDPFVVQYFRWMGNVVHGEFGYSSTAGAPVVEGFVQFFPTTFELVLYAAPLIIVVGIALGTLGAVRKDKPADHITRVIAIVGYSLPTFWLGLILLMVCYGFFGIFPPGSLSSQLKDVIYSPDFHRYTKLLTIDAILNWRWDIWWDSMYRMILPAFNLVVINSALIMRLTRSSMLEALGQDYIMTARAKGADTRTINRKHARRNALLPVITISGLTFAGLMAGMVITETIFDRKGIGWWMARAALQLDVAAIMFNVLFLGVVFVVVNLIVDVIYAYVDPRVRLN